MHYEPWLSLGLFAIDTVIIAIAILIVLAGFIALLGRGKMKTQAKINIEKLNKKYLEMQQELQTEVLSKKELKQLKKQQKQQTKKADKKRKRIFVLNFKGDIKANAVEHLREEITMLLTTATPKDEVLVRLESPGGMVQNYGLAASQLQRIRDQQIPLIAAVDKVAASGGYMMACVANQIIAAPFAILGSIGVVAQLPNFHRFLKKHDIDFEQLTAGKYKRTLTMFGENTDEDRQKSQAIINDIHQLFIEYVKEHRPQVDINEVSTGEFWFGKRAIELTLVDELKTSDDYLLQASKKADIFEISTYKKKKFIEKLFGSAKAELKELAEIRI